MGHYMNERELYMSNASNDKKKITEALRFFLRMEIICRVSEILLKALDISDWLLLLLS